MNSYYHSDWTTLDKLPLRMDGLHMDEIYDNFIRQIAGERLLAKESGETVAPASIKAAIDRDNMLQKLQKQIVTLETKIKSEKQFNKQVKLNADLKMLKKELDEL